MEHTPHLLKQMGRFFYDNIIFSLMLFGFTN